MNLFYLQIVHFNTINTNRIKIINNNIFFIEWNFLKENILLGEFYEVICYIKRNFNKESVLFIYF